MDPQNDAKFQKKLIEPILIKIMDRRKDGRTLFYSTFPAEAEELFQLLITHARFLFTPLFVVIL